VKNDGTRPGCGCSVFSTELTNIMVASIKLDSRVIILGSLMDMGGHWWSFVRRFQCMSVL